MVENFIPRVLDARTLAEVDRAVQDLRDLLEVEHVSFHAVNASGGQYAATTYSGEWIDRYIAEEYDRIDPVVQMGFRSVAPVDWRRMDWSGKVVREFLDEASDAGIGQCGLSLPVRGPTGQFALFTINDRVTTDEWDRKCDLLANDLILVAHYLHQAVMLATSHEEVPPRTEGRVLSPREVDALTLLAIGLSRGQAAEHLEISEHTLRVYIESARSKLQATNTMHAIAKALTSGQIVV